MAKTNEIERCIQALQATALIRDYYASGQDGIERIIEIAKILAAGDSKFGQFGGIQATVADAICKAYLNAPLEQFAKPKA